MANTSEIAVESTSNGTYAEGAITITKPTGLAVGDLMVGCFGLAISNTMTVPSGWTALLNATTTWVITNLDISILYKVADSSDVAASNFSFDVADGVGALTGTLFRISGVNSNDYFTTQSTGYYGSTSATRTHTVSLTPEQTDSLLIAVMGNQPNSAITVSSVSSTGSPVWTEVKDETISAGNFWVGYTLAYDSTTEITNFSAVLNENSDGSNVTIFAVRSRVDSTDGTTLLSVSPTQFTHLGSAGATGTTVLLDVSPTHFNQSGTATAPTQWSNEAKPSTTWTNET